MINLIQKELNFYFKGMFGYFFGAVLLLFAGVYTVMVNCNMAYANFEYTLQNMSFMYLILIPILCMRSVAEERRQRTDQLLFSLPISVSSIIVAKYIAILIVLAVPVGIIGIYPLILNHYGEVPLKIAYCSLLAFFLLGAALSAAGIFLSTLTENQAIAAGLSFAAFLFTYFGSNLTNYIPGTAFASLASLIAVAFLIAALFYAMTKSLWTALGVFCFCVIILEALYFKDRTFFEGLFASMIGNLSVFERFYAFVRGVLDWRAIVYFLSWIVFFLYISIQSVEKRRWS